MTPIAWAILAVALYVIPAAALVLAFCRMARAGTAHLDRLPDDWAGSHPYMPGGSPAGEEPQP